LIYLEIDVKYMLGCRPRVLIVAGDELARSRFRAWVDRPCYDVTATGVFDEALSLSKRASVVLVAGGVPGARHAELVETIARTDSDCAIISLASNIHRGLRCDETLVSPVHPERLQRTVDRFVRRTTYVDCLDALLAAARRAATGERTGTRRLHEKSRQLQHGFDSADFEAVFRAIGSS
jgi:hypothetical protein